MKLDVEAKRMSMTQMEAVGEGRESLPKQQRLLHDLREAHDRAHDDGRRLRSRATVCGYVAAICACVASFSGFFAMVPQIEHVLKISPWMVSAAAALGSVIQIVRRNATWGARADAYYRHSDAVRHLVSRAEYETPASDDQAIARLSQDFRLERDRLGRDLHRIDRPDESVKGDAEKAP